MTAAAQVVRLPDAARRRSAGALRLLHSTSPGEVVAAAAAIQRLVVAHRIDWDDLLRPAPQSCRSAAPPAWRPKISFLLQCCDRLDDAERRFVETIASYANQPSDREVAWLERIADRVADETRG